MSKKVFSAAPGLIAAFLPNATCPACWPVYAGLLSSLGLGFLMQGTYFYFIVGSLLAVSLFSLYYKAMSRRGQKPFVVGALVSTGIIFGRLAEWPELIFYLFALILVVASVWNNWPIKKAECDTVTDGNSACPNRNQNHLEV